MTTFTLNGKTYQTDAETLAVLQSIMPSAKATGDSSAVIAVVELGMATGRITLAPATGIDSFQCPNCPELIAVEGKDVHLCVVRVTVGRKTHVSREYVGYFNGLLTCSKPSYHDVEIELDRHAFDYFSDNDTPEKAAQIAAAAFEPENEDEGNCPNCRPGRPCYDHEPTWAQRRIMEPVPGPALPRLTPDYSDPVFPAGSNAGGEYPRHW